MTGCRPVGVKYIIWGVYVIWVTSTYFSRYLRLPRDVGKAARRIEVAQRASGIIVG